MSIKPIFVATHPRSCSTAFERVFMTCRDTVKCIHEPFGDPYYYGPERLAERYKQDASAREQSGFSHSTYESILSSIFEAGSKGKRVFIKDMAQYLIPPGETPASIAPSLLAKDYKNPNPGLEALGTMPNGSGGAEESKCNGAESQRIYQGLIQSSIDGSQTMQREMAKSAFNTPTERDNPTILPSIALGEFHFAFLLRHPRKSIPSYYRCCTPPLDSVTGFSGFRPDEAGYVELRQLFDYLRHVGFIGPNLAGERLRNQQEKQSDHPGAPTSRERAAGQTQTPEICVIDADDLLDYPEEVIRTFCQSVEMQYDPAMLDWHSAANQEYAAKQFAKWKGFHDDVLHSQDLKRRTTSKHETDAELFEEWVSKYGAEGAALIRQTVEDNVPHYEYLKQFCISITQAGAEQV